MSGAEDDALARIAAALERLAGIDAGAAAPSDMDWHAAPAFVWDGAHAAPVADLRAPALEQLQGIDRQRDRVVDNVARHARGTAAHDMLLWGARGMGKSALTRAATLAADAVAPGRIALVQVGSDTLPSLPALFARLRGIDRQFLVFIDDLGFDPGDAFGPRHLRSWLEGGVEARPANTRLAVTSNRRAIVERTMAEQDDPINPRDAVDDRLALADRFGLSIGFHNASQEDYLAIVAAYADPMGLAWAPEDALEWSRRRGARSGRTAWQYVTEIAGRAGHALPV